MFWFCSNCLILVTFTIFPYQVTKWKRIIPYRSRRDTYWNDYVRFDEPVWPQHECWRTELNATDLACSTLTLWVLLCISLSKRLFCWLSWRSRLCSCSCCCLILWTLLSSSTTRRSLWAGRLARRAVSLWRWLRTWYESKSHKTKNSTVLYTSGTRHGFRIVKLSFQCQTQHHYISGCLLRVIRDQYRDVAVEPELCSEQRRSSCDIPVLWFCPLCWFLSLVSPDPAAAVGPPAAPVEPAQLHSPELWSYGCIACSGPAHPYLKKPP